MSELTYEFVIGLIVENCILELDFPCKYGAVVDLVAGVLRGSFWECRPKVGVGVLDKL